MNFEPRNRHLLVERIEKEEHVSHESTGMGVLVPEGYEKVEEYTLLRVLKTSPDCSAGSRKSEKVVVPTHLIQDIEVGDETFSIVLENHVCGVVINK